MASSYELSFRVRRTLLDQQIHLTMMAGFVVQTVQDAARQVPAFRRRVNRQQLFRRRLFEQFNQSWQLVCQPLANFSQVRPGGRLSDRAAILAKSFGPTSRQLAMSG